MHDTALQPKERPPATRATPGARSGIVTLIAASKLLEGALLLLIAFGAFRLLHHDVEETVRQWVQAVHLDPGGGHLRGLLARLLSVDDRKLHELGIATFIYAALFLVEGVGLFMQKRWAEYLTVVTTSLLIPVEIYEIVEHATVTKVAVLLVNVAIVAYLIVRLRRGRESRSA